MNNASNGSDVSQMLHDLRGPVLTIRGFSQEVGNAVQDLLELVDRERGSLSGEFHEKILELIEGDIAPCVRFMRSATNQLDSRLTGLDMQNETEMKSQPPALPERNASA